MTPERIAELRSRRTLSMARYAVQECLDEIERLQGESSSDWKRGMTDAAKIVNDARFNEDGETDLRAIRSRIESARDHKEP